MRDVDSLSTLIDRLKADVENAEKKTDRDEFCEIAGTADHRNGIENLIKKLNVADGVNRKFHD